ncbi:MAG: bifunctional oligoribonuclease/PAP phosphatase NrnA [Bacteroidetes bacterium]|nr:MAG: bifunctional oligoribonuclease/PAP phosphatase NrnA [Bacteroidota bacterium]
MEQISKLKELLHTPKRIAIIAHQKPDGDAIGSSLGLYHYLVQLGHRVKVIMPTDYAENLKELPGTSDIAIGTEDIDSAKWEFESSDLIFCLDFNAIHRVNEFGKPIMESPAVKILIDHHLEPEDFADLTFLDSTASSTAEMVFRIIQAMGDDDKINADMAAGLYAGVMTDTGSFRFSSTTPAVHRMVARLLETGINVTKIHEDIYDNYTENRLRFLGHCFSHCLKVLPEYKTAYMVVDRPIFKKYYIKAGDTEGLVNYALSLKNINFGVLITSNDEMVKLSFRSRGSFAANEFAKHFNGGGHFYAAGGKSKESLEEVEKKFLTLLEQYKDQLNFA